jgi:pimeloyl-ACP methyl ester carboxylesterase
MRSLRTPTRPLPGVALALAIVGLLVAVPVPVGATPTSTPEFYTEVPANLDAFAPGDVIRWEPETDLWWTLSALTAYRVMYRSDGASGEAVAETAMVFVPEGPTPEGGWTVVAWAHGTSGVGDACAPSKYPSLYPSPWPGYVNEVAHLVHQGHVVVAPDYEGLGTPGRHTYLHTDAQANAVIDGVRAARALAGQVAGAATDTRWAVVGHSQGGQAAAGAAELASARAPELELVGAVLLAPAMGLRSLTRTMASNAPWFPYTSYVGAGIGATHPGFDYAAFVGPQLLPLMAYAEELCFDEWFGAALTYYRPGLHRNLAAGWSQDPNVRDYFASARIGTRPAVAPMLVQQGTSDILYRALDRQVATFCAQGDAVAWDVYLHTNHGLVVPRSWPTVRDWLADRFEGKPAPSDC